VKEVLDGDDAIVIRHSIPVTTSPRDDEPPKSSKTGASNSKDYLLRSVRHRPTSRGSLFARMDRSVFQHTRFQPTPDQIDQARVTDSLFYSWSRILTSWSLPSLMKMKDGMLPRRSSSV
jgi:site-specific DNA recombinase